MNLTSKDPVYARDAPNGPGAVAGKDVLISVVNGNTSGMIEKCVESIYEHTRNVTFDVVVIDNATGYTRLRQIEDLGSTVIVNDSPKGFGANHAQVLKLLDGYRYLVLFNDDAFLLNDAISELVRYMDDDEMCAVSSCHIEHPSGVLQPNAAPFLSLGYFVRNALGLDKKPGELYSDVFADYIDYEQTQTVDWVTGCCMAIRSEFIRKFGFLDTNYFMFLEDTDFCKKARANGFSTAYVASGRIAHYGALSSKDGAGKFRPEIYITRQRSRLYYLSKLSSVQYLTYLTFINLVTLAKIVKSVVTGDVKRGTAIWRSMKCRPLS